MRNPDLKENSRNGPEGGTEENAKEFFPDFASVRTALEAGQIGVWSWDIATNKVTWSSNLESIHGMPAGSFEGTYRSFESDIHEDDRSGVAARIDEALRTGNGYRARYRISGLDGREERWLESSGTVVAEDGGPGRMLGICRDITAQVKVENELRSRVRQQEALAQLGDRALAEPDIERLLNDVVSTVALTLAVDFVEILELLPGDSELLLRTGFGWKAGHVGTIVASTAPNSYAHQVLNTFVPVISADLRAETRFTVPAYLHDHACVSGMSTRIVGRDERAFGLLGICTLKPRRFGIEDAAFLAAVANLVSGAIQRRQLEQRHELMIREMRHRSGNLFSQLLALFSQTAKTSRNKSDLMSKYQARVLALANAHRMITESGWKSIPIMELLYDLLGPYLERTAFSGPNIDLEPDPTFSLSAALHELTANAVKHGSLSRRDGRLDLKWSVSRTPRGLTLTFEWNERKGPPARQPRRFGFGSRLIGLVIERQLNGEVYRSFTRDGFSVRMVVPLTRERWPSHLPVTRGSAEAGER